MLNINKAIFNSKTSIPNFFSKSTLRRNFASLAKFDHTDALNFGSLLNEEEKMVLLIFLINLFIFF